MTTSTKKRKKKPRRGRIVQGIDHGFNGYTNHKCRCKVCTEGDREHHKEYRDKRFAGRPLCIVPNCPRVQSRAHGYGFCYVHGTQMLEMRKTRPVKAKRVAKKLGIELKPLPGTA